MNVLYKEITNPNEYSATKGIIYYLQSEVYRCSSETVTMDGYKYIKYTATDHSLRIHFKDLGLFSH